MVGGWSRPRPWDEAWVVLSLTVGQSCPVPDRGTKLFSPRPWDEGWMRRFGLFVGLLAPIIGANYSKKIRFQDGNITDVRLGMGHISLGFSPPPHFSHFFLYGGLFLLLLCMMCPYLTKLLLVMYISVRLQRIRNG